MKIAVVTIFPEIIEFLCEKSIVGRAQKNKLVKIKTYNPRDFTADRRLSVDDCAYGGGPGMILKPEPIFLAVEKITRRKYKRSNKIRQDGRKPPNVLLYKTKHRGLSHRIVLLSPQGEVFSQEKAKELVKEKNLILICGHYKDVDERIRENLITDEISIGDYVLTGGELPALVLIDSIVRLLPKAMSNEQSYKTDSFYNGKLLDGSYYTKPFRFRDMETPRVLLSGHHANIEKWRREKALQNTFIKRPDLLEKARLSKTDRAIIEKMKNR